MTDTPTTYGFADARYARFPPVVQVALVSGVCSSNCAYCPMGRKNTGELPRELAAELPKRFFDPALFHRIADQMSAYPWSILRIHSRGEPMLHPSYFSMIEYASRHGVTVTSFTNGLALQRHVDAVLDCGLAMIEVSADAVDEESYRRWRRNPNFQDLVDGVRRLHAARNGRRQAWPRIVVSAVDHPEFRPYREAFSSFWQRISDKIVVRPFHTYAGRIHDPYAPERQRQGDIPCVQLWERFSVSPDGLVNACFNDWGDREIVGDIRVRTIADVWTGEPFAHIRRAALNGLPLQCCERCSGPSVSSWGRDGYQHWVAELLAGKGDP